MPRTPRSGFSLIELLVVIAIIGILAGLIFPIAQGSMRRSKRVECLNNMRQWGDAFVNYLDNSRGIIPGNGSGLADEKAWFNVLPPYLNGVNKPLKDMDPIPHPGNAVRGIFLCPADQREDQTGSTGYYSSYSFNTQLATVKRLRISNIKQPGILVIMSEVADGSKSGVNLGSNFVGTDRNGQKLEAIRHSGSINLLLADGHAESAIGTAVWKEGLSPKDDFGDYVWNPPPRDSGSGGGGSGGGGGGGTLQ